ncbi:hypothetical protein NMA58_00475 [Rhizobium sp. YTUHZ045]|uniref:hypothetical protein n=1 Tax=Rhizobium sp. YTUHZ045 TaxID=2962888 RepID=UPI003DA97264
MAISEDRIVPDLIPIDDPAAECRHRRRRRPPRLKGGAKGIGNSITGRLRAFVNPDFSVVFED